MIIFIVVIGIYLLIDIYAFKGINNLISHIDLFLYRKLLRTLYWGTTAAVLVFIAYLMVQSREGQSARLQSQMFFAFGLMMALLVPKLVFIVFHFAEDLIAGASFLIKKLGTSSSNYGSGTGITRLEFISRIGLGVAAIPFISIIYGMTKGRFNFRKEFVNLKFDHLPNNLNGFRIVQISDMHLGSFYHHKDKVQAAIDMINQQHADVVLFTGDMVNDLASEINGFEEILSGIKARYGKFSILGNHDYGDYAHWNSEEEKSMNLKTLKQRQRDMGFDVLLNENRTIEVNGSRLKLVGVENWGDPPFPQYGDLNKAMNQVSEDDFTVLMSHDPTHWDREVIGKTNVELTLSGHTHGMQFGLEIGNIKWSPVKLKYPRWGGLYKEGKQYLYVNRGFGTIGFPGRVGMPPEITVIDLFSGSV